MGAAPGAARWFRIVRSRPVALADEAPVVVLSAPGGFGKSTLAQQLAESSSGPIIKVSLVPDTTLDQLVVALVRATRRAGLSDLAATLTGLDPDEVLDRLVGTIAERSEPVVLLVDDLQLADDAAQGWIRELIAHRPSPLRVIVATRQAEHRLLGRYGGEGVALGADELAFTTTEVAALIEREPDDSSVQRLVETTQGWPAAIAIAAAALRFDPTWTIERIGGTGAVLARLVDDLLGDAADELRRITCLPLLDHDVVALVAGERLLPRLEAAAVPLVPRGRWLVLPDPIREAMPGPLLDEAVAAEIAKRYAAGGELATACQWLATNDHLDALAEVIASQHWSALEAIGVAPLRAYVELVGEECLAARPKALLNAVWFSGGRDNVRRTAWTKLGVRLTEPTTVWGRAFRAELCHEVNWEGRQREALEMATALLAELPPSEPITRGRTLLAAANVQVLVGGGDALAQADDRLAEAATLFRASGERRWESDTWLRAGYAVSFHHGRAAQAVERMERCLALLPEHSRDQAIALTYFCDVLDFAGRGHDAEVAAMRAVEIGRRLDDSMIVAYGAWAAAWACAHRGDLSATVDHLAEVDRHRASWFVSEAGVEYLMIATDMLASLGPDTGWQRYRDEFLERIEGNPIWEDAHLAIRCRVESMWGDAEQAEVLLAQRESRPYARDHDRWIRLLLRAVAARRRADLELAARLVGEARNEVERIGVPHLWWVREPVVRAMLADVTPDDAADRRADDLGFAVTVLGGFAVRRAGVDVTPAAGNPAALVKMLAVRGPLVVDVAIDDLWPDADPATGRSRLRNLLNRLRTQSGKLVVRDGDVLSLIESVEVDMHRFERAADAVLGGDEPPGRAAAARLALGTYAGELLPHDRYSGWTEAPRERLRRRYVALLDLAVDGAIESDQLDEAMRLLEMAIEAEPYGVERYERAVELLLRQGRVETARRVSTLAEAALREVGVAPGPQVGELLRSPERTGAAAPADVDRPLQQVRPRAS